MSTTQLVNEVIDKATSYFNNRGTTPFSPAETLLNDVVNVILTLEYQLRIVRQHNADYIRLLESGPS